MGGNISTLINTQQMVVAKYLYDPFGGILSESGPLADANLYRFSSKEVHPNSGLVYYQARYYDPGLQCWINRDPIGESGGINLYAFAGNSPLGAVGQWGMRIDYNEKAVARGNLEKETAWPPPERSRDTDGN